MKQNLKKHTILILAVILLAVVLVGTTGWYYWPSSTVDDDTAAMEQIKMKRVEQERQEFEAANYLPIPAWDVMIGVGPNLPKITVSEPIDLGNNKSEITITVKPPFLVYKDCGSEMKVARSLDVTGIAEEPIHEIDNYYYYNSSVSDCSQAEESLNIDVLNHTELVEHFDSIGVKSL